MRASHLIIVSTLAASLACGGAMTPPAPRDEIAFSFNKVPPAFEPLDLPWHGGKIVMSSDTMMVVSYNSRVATPDQLRQLWPEALTTAGWRETSRMETGNGTLTVIYRDAADKTVTLSIRPEGSLWQVNLIQF